jgi:hypothetical protein
MSADFIVYKLRVLVKRHFLLSDSDFFFLTRDFLMT